MKDNETISSNKTPLWIKKLQENSWELELLISGGVIFSLFQLADVFLGFSLMMKMTSAFPGTDALIILGMLGIKILTVGFSVHLLLRAYWLGMVCVNYVFPEGIKEKAFKNKIPFKDSFRDGGSMQNEIISIDKASGSVMYISIITALVLIGILFSLLFLLLLTYFFGLFGLAFNDNIVIYTMLIYFADLILFGFLRKIKYLSYVLYPIFKVYDFITLRFVYQRSLDLFSSNVIKWRAVLGVISLIFLSVFFTYTSIYRIMHWPNAIDVREHRWEMAPSDNFMSHARYLDQVQRENFMLITPVIQSELITDNHLMIYIPYNKRYDSMVELKEGETLASYVEVMIDDSLYSNVNWFNYWPDKNEEIGLKTYVDIKGLKRGQHFLKLSFNGNSAYRSEIAFWKDAE
ncbi:MAG: hypothetical protein DRI86_09600 [Bacteroidetes bacterium]|nr:MAG: hypothetical protein DRI86_09600 [Bacteroidota bacterium]